MPDTDTTFSSPTGTDDSSSRFIAARVLAHPHPRRVGDFAPLFDAGGGGERSLSISRLSPDFRTPAGGLSGPLGTTRLSRNPVQLTREEGGLRLHHAFANPAVEVNGRALVGERLLSEGELQAGVVLLLGKDVALWIGWLDLIEPAPAVAGLIGESTVMRQLRQQIHRVADLDVPVLLRGATGVGKELVAAAIHKYSPRAGQSYVAVNVAGVPPSMAAAELFGHKRGAFTGATEERKGYFAQAHGGTLFLDEIGDVSFDVQALLLRAVQEKVIQPLGGTTREVNVRLIAATDSDLESAVARREFREPLLRRFSYEIHVPPLRMRRDDVGLLFYHLLRDRLQSMDEGQRMAAADNDGEPVVPASYVAQMALYDWTGNVRELANVALKFAIENRGRARSQVTDELRKLLRPRATAAAGGAAGTSASGTAAAATTPVRPEEVTDADIGAALQAEGFRRERAAKRLGISKTYLYKRLEGNPEMRSAQEIPTDEIQTTLTACGGDVLQAADRLRVSGRALRLQLKRLGGGTLSSNDSSSESEQ